MLQILTLVGLLTFCGYIINNAIANLALLGKTFSFSFLVGTCFLRHQPASDRVFLDEYACPAAIVGILNTLLVAVCGIILATVLGFIMGVLRLSPNWLVNRLVYCIIEFVRNVPVLLHILLMHGIIVHSLPQPRGLPDWANFGDLAFLTNRGLFVPSPHTGKRIWPWWSRPSLRRSGSLVVQASCEENPGRNWPRYLPVFWISLGRVDRPAIDCLSDYCRNAAWLGCARTRQVQAVRWSGGTSGIHGSVACTVDLHGLLHCRDRACRYYCRCPKVSGKPRRRWVQAAVGHCAA